MSVKYEYKMIEIDTHTMVQNKNEKNAAAEYLQNIIDPYVLQGWEFYRMDLIGVAYTPSLGRAFSALTGTPDGGRTAYVITFRREI